MKDRSEQKARQKVRKMISSAIAEDAEAVRATKDAEQKYRSDKKKGLLPMKGTFPETKENCFSRFSFHYLAPLINLGYKRPLRHADLWALPDEESVNKLLGTFQKCKSKLDAEKAAAAQAQASVEGGSDSGDVESDDTATPAPFPLGRTLWAQFQRGVVVAGVFMFFQVALQISGPLLIREIVLSVSSPSADDPFRGLYLAFIYFGIQLLNALCVQQHLHNASRVGKSAEQYLVLFTPPIVPLVPFAFIISCSSFAFRPPMCFLDCVLLYVPLRPRSPSSPGQRMRALLMALVYRKALELRLIDMGSENHGNIVNLMSNDAQKFFDIMPVLHLLWAAPLQIVLAALFLILYLSWCV